jgi:hypothetical protein
MGLCAAAFMYQGIKIQESSESENISLPSYTAWRCFRESCELYLQFRSAVS